MMWLRAIGRWVASVPGWLWAGFVGALLVAASALTGYQQGRRQRQLEECVEDAEVMAKRDEAISAAEKAAQQDATKQIEEAVEEELEALGSPPTWEEIDALEAEADAWDLPE